MALSHNSEGVLFIAGQEAPNNTRKREEQNLVLIAKETRLLATWLQTYTLALIAAAGQCGNGLWWVGTVDHQLIVALINHFNHHTQQRTVSLIVAMDYGHEPCTNHQHPSSMRTSHKARRVVGKCLTIHHGKLEKKH